MSSLLQFDGNISSRGVQLQFYRMQNGKSYGSPSLDMFSCHKCGGEHELIGLAWRKPAGMFGPWVRFRYLGSTHAPDISGPIAVPAWPIGTVVQSPTESMRIWHS